MVSRTFLIALIWAALALVVAIAVLAGVSALLRLMEDEVGASWTGRLALVLGVIWVVDLVVLILAMAVKSVGLSHNPPAESDNVE